ncbi:MAG TPA: helix-turn-helix transcriptional regulator, partial [Polyangiaceae bacterium]
MPVLRTVRPIRVVLGEARSALTMTQHDFGYAIGASHRTATRWDAGRSVPAVHHLVALARLLFPVSRTLAEEVANHA